MENMMLPMGVRRDGSFYTRIEWASSTEPDPTFWVCNLISDDHERNGGTYGANTEEKTDVVLSFFGEKQRIGKIKVFKNVGATISVPEELAKVMNIYVCNNDEPLKLRGKDDNIDDIPWKLVSHNEMVKEFGWQELKLEKPVDAKYIRLEMVGNFCEKGENFIPWIETSELKVYPD